MNPPHCKHVVYKRLCPHHQEASINWLKSCIVQFLKLNILVITPVCNFYNFSIDNLTCIIILGTEQVVDQE